MTEQKAIEMLKYIRYAGEYKKRAEAIAIDMAIEALEKQIPKKPIFKGNFWIVPYCPSCEKVVGVGQGYCDKCGQKLDWEEGDDDEID